MKWCSKCGKSKPATLVHFRRVERNKERLRSWCRECDREYMRKYRLQHLQQEIKRCRKYYSTIKGHLRSTFNSMKQRCSNPKMHNYYRYGGRGIKVKFKNVNEFIDYVLNELKVDPRGLTIDRINNDGNYEPGNIRFVTRKVNRNNRRK